MRTKKLCLGIVCLPSTLAGVMLVFGIAPARQPAAMPAKSARQPEAQEAKPHNTRHELIATKLAFNQRTLVGDYQRIGKRDAIWDADAEEFLEQMARYFTRSGEQVWYQIEASSADELLPTSKHLTEELGCDDPLVLYCTAVLQMDGADDVEQYKAGCQTAIDAYEALRAGGYNMWRKKAAADRVVRIIKLAQSPWAGAPIGEQAAKDAFEFEVACFTTDAFTPEEARLLLEQIWRPKRAASPKGSDLKVFVDAIAQTKTQEWAALIVRGDYHVACAWDARGGDWAANVSPQQWEGFRRELALAQPLYIKAHRMHPDRPEAAASLITICMAGHEPPGTDTLFWFEAAIKAQLDYDPAWEAYRWSIFPRWGGSHREMLALGQLAVSTGRFDTDVPMRMSSQLHQITWDTKGDWQAVRNLGPVVWRDLERMYAGYISHLADKWNGSAFAAERLARAWVLEQWEAGARLLAEGGEEIGVNSTPFRGAEFARVGMVADDAIAEILARASEHGAAIRRAETLDEKGNRDAADAAWKQLQADIPADSPARPYLESCVWRREFLLRVQNAPAGEWIDVPVDPKYWFAIQGDWQFKGNQIIGTVSQDRRSADERFGSRYAQPVLVFAVPLPESYEIRACIGRLENQEGKPCETGYCGVQPAFGPFTSGCYLLNRFDGQLGLYQDGKWRTRGGFGGGDELHMEVTADGSSQLWVDGILRVQRATQLASPAAGSPRRFAIVTIGAHLGDHFDVYQIQIRRLAGGPTLPAQRSRPNRPTPRPGG